MLNKYLISGFIFLTFNHASAQTFGAKQVISSSANGARSVFAVDSVSYTHLTLPTIYSV